jgi:pyridoxine 4-dehydrogenase
VTTPAAAAGTVTLGGDLSVSRMGYGAMRITGEGIWGEPADRDNAIAVLRRAVELGVDLIDTADSYGPVRGRGPDPRGAAHRPWRRSLRWGDVATKAGLVRTGPASGTRSVARVPALRLRDEPAPPGRRADRPLPAPPHRPAGPAEEQFGVLADLQREGKIRHLGLSEVSVASSSRPASTSRW